jgi:hypothetical protein
MTQKYKTRSTELGSEEGPQSAVIGQPKSNLNAVAPLGVDAKFPAYVNTLAETARGLKMSEKSLRRLIERKLLIASRGLRHIRITREAIEAYLAKTSK